MTVFIRARTATIEGMRAPACFVLALLLGLTGLAAAPATLAATAPRTLIGAGDIAVCGSNVNDTKTAALVKSVLDADTTAWAFTAGDNVYPNGSSNYFASCYAPTWGQFKQRTRPVPGNHDYSNNPNAEGYFGYFGLLAGPGDRGWYRYDLGTWRIYALSSECAQGTTCFNTQYDWLKNDLNAYPRQCVLAIWHQPRFSSGAHGNSTRMDPVWKLLYAHHAELVVSGHDHDYERFARMDGTGKKDAIKGMRQFVVGTGGANLRPFATKLGASQVRNATSHGVLRLVLREGSYEWHFMPIAGDSFSDAGSNNCS
jgi:calcineurin-like phosphoesterase family protein